MAYSPIPARELGFYASVSALLSQPYGIFSRYLPGLDLEFRRQAQLGFSAADAVLDRLDPRQVPEEEWDEALRDELLSLQVGPG